jgi:methionyl-tRNA formyltransferase
MREERLDISILVDDPLCWIMPFAEDICRRLSKDHNAGLYLKASEVPTGDMLFLLGCTSIIPDEILRRNKHNLVVHESDLPKGRGWSPLTWQVIEGKNRIPILLFEATEELDGGAIYFKDYIELDGTELLPEIKRKQGEKTAELVYRFVESWPDALGMAQDGVPTYYKKRTEFDDELDANKTIAESFNLLRIAHNEEHPAWFRYRGKKYILKIFEKKETVE